MKLLRVLLLISMVATTFLLSKVPVRHWSVLTGAGLFGLSGLLMIIKLVTLEKGLEQRLERLATLASAREAVERVEASVLDRQLRGALEEVRVQEKVVEEPTPDSRLARVLRDDYPL